MKHIIRALILCFMLLPISSFALSELTTSTDDPPIILQNCQGCTLGPTFELCGGVNCSFVVYKCSSTSIAGSFELSGSGIGDAKERVSCLCQDGKHYCNNPAKYNQILSTSPMDTCGFHHCRPKNDFNLEK